MFAVIYRFKLRPHQELAYKEYWQRVASYFIEKCGAMGSCLHKGEDELWVAYSRWPDKATRDAVWPGGEAIFPKEVSEAIAAMQEIRKENADLGEYDEIGLEVVSDLL